MTSALSLVAVFTAVMLVRMWVMSAHLRWARGVTSAGYLTALSLELEELSASGLLRDMSPTGIDKTVDDIQAAQVRLDKLERDLNALYLSVCSDSSMWDVTKWSRVAFVGNFEERVVAMLKTYVNGRPKTLVRSVA